MYAAYGLDKNELKIEKFLGYLPDDYFYKFKNPSAWRVEIVETSDGTQIVGRLCGRAFFTDVRSASATDVGMYLGDSACAATRDQGE